MNEIVSYFWAFLAGVFLGLFYFGGLWLTLRRLSATGQSTLFLLASFLGRNGVVLAGFYFVMQGQWQRILVCLAGFVVMRTLLFHFLRPRPVTVVAPSGGLETWK